MPVYIWQRQTDFQNVYITWLRIKWGKDLIYFIHYKFKQSYDKSMLKEPDSRLSTAGDALIPPDGPQTVQCSSSSVDYKVWKRNATTGLTKPKFEKPKNWRSDWSPSETNGDKESSMMPIDEWHKRLRVCVHARREHFEYLLSTLTFYNFTLIHISN